ncbi:hypothetical protein LTR10_000589 [Elasticomyces elasticus]|nr:hypothetical protein LTR10_000589 [Elasticomyces elasticus]KAK4980163.1 hypothetical protein LTR42_000470 [Elasticomyces elasticus]
MSDQTQNPSRGVEEIVQELDDHYTKVDEALISVTELLVGAGTGVQIASASLVTASAEVQKARSAATDMHHSAGELGRVLTGEKHDLAQKNHQVEEPGYKDDARKSITYGAE